MPPRKPCSAPKSRQPWQRHPLSTFPPRGVSSWREASQWLRARGIEDIECITPDLAGVPRGKMMPTAKFTGDTSLALPSALYRHTISGEYPDETANFRYEPRDSDLKLVPDLSTLSVVPWESDQRRR